MKYKIAGIANYLAGGGQILFTLIFFFFVIPHVRSLHQEFSADTPLTESYIPIVITSIVNIVLGSLNIFWGYKLFSLKGKLREKYFTISIIFLIVTFVADGILTQLTVLSVLMPIYNLTTSLN